MPENPLAPVVEELVPAPDPAHCCALFDGLPYRILLDSAVRSPSLGRYSFLTADPIGVVRSKGHRSEYIDLVGGATRAVAGDALEVVRAQLAPHAGKPVEGLPPFQGGAADYLAYDWGRTLERLPSPRYDDLDIPDVVLGIYDWVIAWDHQASAAWLISTGMPERAPETRARRALERAMMIRARLESSVASRQSSVSHGSSVASPQSRDGGPWVVVPSHPVESGWWDPCLELRSSFTHTAYLDAVARVREYILAGDIFQANLSQRFEAPLRELPWSLYSRLRARTPTPFAAFLDFPDAIVLSVSPERFLRVDADGRVETRPIKGTLPRGVGPEHDAALGAALVDSAKDRAENLMIVDLMRNDLSRVCAPGTVHVRELFALERYASVHHLVSTVVGRLAPAADALDLLRATFPGGSITGAPKVRAMEVIAELEPSQRGVYCGSIGYWSVTGALDTSIAIRTALVQGDRVLFSAGGGIVADSDPEQEYRETLDKVRGMIEALAASA